jgi:uncharacterized membrane protein
MKITNTKSLLAVILCMAAALSFAAECTGIEYDYVAVLPPGWVSAYPTDINDSGAVAGFGDDGSGRQKGFIYSKGTYTTLMPPDCTRAFVSHINNREEVLIEGENCVMVNGFDECSKKIFVYRDGIYTELLPPGCEGLEDCVRASDINNSGTVVGTKAKWLGTHGTNTGFIYSEGEYTELLPRGWEAAEAYGINDAGTVVGVMYKWIGRRIISKGFIYSNGRYTRIKMPGWRGARPYAINNSNVVVGEGYQGYKYPDLINKGFIYSGGACTPLLPAGWEWAAANDINDSGTVVGSGAEISTIHGFKEWRAKWFVYSKGEYTELQPFGWFEAGAAGINDEGMVVGSANNEDIFGNTQQKGFIAVPILKSFLVSTI